MPYRETTDRRRYQSNRYKLLRKEEPQKWWIYQLRSKSKKLGLDFDLTAEDIMIPTHCPVFGIELTWEGDRDSMPSIDRIENNRGYVKGNIIVVSFRANRIKSDATTEELLKLARFYGKESGKPTSTAHTKSTGKRGRRKVVESPRVDVPRSGSARPGRGG